MARIPGLFMRSLLRDCYMDPQRPELLSPRGLAETVHRGESPPRDLAETTHCGKASPGDVTKTAHPGTPSPRDPDEPVHRGNILPGDLVETTHRGVTPSRDLADSAHREVLPPQGLAEPVADSPHREAVSPHRLGESPTPSPPPRSHHHEASSHRGDSDFLMESFSPHPMSCCKPKDLDELRDECGIPLGVELLLLGAGESPELVKPGFISRNTVFASRFPRSLFT